jgi:hypothetical protein
MKHFPVSAWTDLARELASQDEAGALRAHLAGGCEPCRNLAGFLIRLAALSGRLAQGAVPENAVRLAKAIFPGYSAEPRRVTRILAELIFDGRTTAVLAGLRSTWQVGSQSVYRAGDCCLDLRIEPEASTSRAAVIGQISNYRLPANRMSDVTVRLKAGRLVVAEARSNEFGEFQLEYEQQERLQLCVYLDGGSRYIQVPLKKCLPDHPGPRERIPLGAIGGKQSKGPVRSQGKG